MEKGCVNMNEVRIWEERVTIPTYEAGEPDKNPMFLEKRVYQGSSGKVYPYPTTEKISHEKKDKEYQAVFLENEYLKVMILPEIGGRIRRHRVQLAPAPQADHLYADRLSAAGK